MASRSKSRRRSPYKRSARGRSIRFKTKRGRTVYFHAWKKNPRRKNTKTIRAFKASSAACLRKRIRPFTKPFGKCMKVEMKRRLAA